MLQSVAPLRLMTGKKTAFHSPKTPNLKSILFDHLPTPPSSADWGKALTTWPMWRNGDQLSDHQQTIPGLGDCTAVSVASAIRVMTYNRGGEILLTDDDVVNNIYAKNGFDPLHPNTTDNGAVETDVLNTWMRTGYAINGEQAPDVLTGYGYVNPLNPLSVKRAISMLGGLFIGLSLPDYALSQDADWVAPRQSFQVAGGHAVFVHGYDQNWLYLNSWGARKRMDWGFFGKFCDEAYGLLSRDWLRINGLSPANENFAQLAAEMKAAM